MGNIHAPSHDPEVPLSSPDQVSLTTRSRLNSCLNGVGSVASGVGFVAGKTVQIGVRTSAQFVRGLFS